MNNPHGRWEVCLPIESHARIYRQYPLSASNFIPIEFIIDGRFEPDPERSIALMNESDKQVMSQGLGAAVIAVSYALDQGWRSAHLLARADSPASGFNPADHDETTWWRNELRAFVEKLGALPIVETSTGRLPALESELADAHVDFISPRLLEGSDTEDTSVDRLWLLFEEA